MSELFNRSLQYSLEDVFPQNQEALQQVINQLYNSINGLPKNASNVDTKSIESQEPKIGSPGIISKVERINADPNFSSFILATMFFAAILQKAHSNQSNAKNVEKYIHILKSSLFDNDL
jgi:hypothetical protein